MLSSLPASRTLTILRDEVTGRDAYGVDTVSLAEIAVPGCGWWPSEASEAEQGRDTTTTTYQAILPAGTDVRASDHVRLSADSLWPSAVWRVDGDPRQHWSPITGSVGGVTVWLVKVSG